MKVSLNVKRWFQKHSLKLLAIRDTPQAIAGGVAIGIFFGFTPLFGLKTVLAILVAWLTGSNILAAVIAGAMHDIIIPLMPAIYLWEYGVGYWLLSHPHTWPVPPPMHRLHREFLDWHTWANFFFGSVGRRLVLGGFIVATPFSLLAFGLTHILVSRHHKKREQAEATKPAP